MSKGKNDKNRAFVVNLKHDGMFSPYPFSYMYGDEKHFTDFNFEGMPYDNLRELVRKLVHAPPILGMRYDHPEQLKLALANYGVAGRYQLWFQKNDWRELLVYCGRDVSTGRCAWYHSKKVKAKKQLFTELHDDANKGTSKDGEGSSRNSDVSPKWTKSKIASSRKSGQPVCGFRLWASWMSTENSFQIKSLKAAHNLGQCKRAKQRVLYDFEGGLIEHYARLWEYRHAILDTNPGSICILDDEETEYGNTYFRRFYIRFKGVKDGWKAEDLELGHGTCITIISDSHKGLLDVVSDWLQMLNT
nr:hypothetical protein [Tanacetum cinerariifolium]